MYATLGRLLVEIRRAQSSFLTVVALAIAIACSGGGNNSDGTTSPPPPPVGGFTISASGSPLTIARNGNGSGTITIARSGGFTGSVSLSTTGLTTGVTAAFSPAQLAAGEASSTMTVSVGGAAATGTTMFTVRATSS